MLGDIMKVKKWHIYIIAILCFATSFVAINKKYDPFYRVNGINNDNRALIEQYLDGQQQQYLIDNSIAVDLFIQYINVPGFLLQNYEYYNMLNKSKKFDTHQDIIDSGNIIASRLEVSFGNTALKQCQNLVSNNLVLPFLKQDQFDFQNIKYYQIIRVLYNSGEYQYIEDANTYAARLQSEGGTSEPDKIAKLKELAGNYDKDSLHLLLTTPLPEGTTIVSNPGDLSVVVDSTHFIGSYQPKQIVAIPDISRETYSMYLDQDAYTHLKAMTEDLKSACGDGLILRRSYRSYDILSVQEKPLVLEVAGYSESQLGTTVAFQQKYYSLEDFDETASYQWLLENASRYGYILRYPQGKEEITGKASYNNIFRYVGVELATILQQNQWTLEEYNAQKNQNTNVE